MDTQPTVTVSVITYNSSKYVLETLESIKTQTYPNLILHICDDCSTDNTVEMCREWIEENKGRFVSTDIIVPCHNTGVSGNCNRSLDACNTEWIKLIAGDDRLLPNCIEDNINYVKSNKDAYVVFSKMKCFGIDTKKCNSFESGLNYSFYLLPQEEQNKLLHISNRCLAPVCFLNRNKIKELGVKYDERIPNNEDHAMWINLSDKGLRFHFLNKATVLYRISEGSLSTSTIPSFRYVESLRLNELYYLCGIPQEYHSIIPQIIKSESTMIRENIHLRGKVLSLQNSKSYMLGHFLLKPLTFIKEFLYNIREEIRRM